MDKLYYVARKIIGQKFITFVVSTALLWYDKINDVTWLTIACVFMGLNVSEKLLEKIGGAK